MNDKRIQALAFALNLNTQSGLAEETISNQSRQSLLLVGGIEGPLGSNGWILNADVNRFDILKDQTLSSDLNPSDLRQWHSSPTPGRNGPSMCRAASTGTIWC